MPELHGYFEFDQSRQDPFLYPLLFRESIYGFARDHALNSSPFYNSSLTNKLSSVLVKRFIHRMYDPLVICPTYSTQNQNPFLGHNKNVYSQMISEVFADIAEIPLFLQLVSS